MKRSAVWSMLDVNAVSTKIIFVVKLHIQYSAPANVFIDNQY